MRAILSAAALALLAACASTPQPEPAAPDTGTIVGGVNSPQNRARIHTELASAYYASGNLAVALEELRNAQRADPNYAPTQSMFGLVYMEMHENQLAEQSFERALKLAPTDGDINHNYGWFLCETHRERDSIAYFMKAVQNPLYGRRARTYAAAGVCALRMSDSKSAEQYFQQALRIEPDQPAALLELGKIRYRERRMPEARRLVARFNNLVSPTAESLWLALRIERKSGSRVDEYSYADQLRRRFPDSPEYRALQRGDFD